MHAAVRKKSINFYECSKWNIKGGFSTGYVDVERWKTESENP